jgi:integrase
MRIYKRGKVYWFEFEFKRERYRESTKSKNLREATTIASAFRTAVAMGNVGVVERKPSPAFGAAMKAFLAWSSIEHGAHPETYKRYTYSSLRLLKAFRDMPLDRITPEDVEQFKQKRAGEKGKHTKRKLRPATVNRELACLRAMFNHAIKAHPDLRNPVSAVAFLAEDNLQDRVLTYTEQKAYLSAAAPTLRDVATTILDTGMRPEEVFTLRAPNLFLEDGYLRVLRGKTPAAKRRIDLSPGVLGILTRRLEVAGQGYLFPCDGDPARPLESIQSAHERALKESKVAAFRPYDLRHTFATRAAEVVDLVTLAAMLGHSRIQMVLRYAHPTQIHQSSSMEKLMVHRKDQEAKEHARVKAEEDRRGNAGMHIVKRSA